MRAREPDLAGSVVRDGVTLGYEVHGQEHAGPAPAILLLPTWTIVHSRFWKLQVPYLARHHRVIVYDGPGNGTSDRTTDPLPYEADAQAAHAAAVLDACEVARAVVVGLSLGARWALDLADLRPEAVCGVVLVAPSLALVPPLPERAGIAEHFHDPAPDHPKGWDRYNLDYWHRHYGEFTRWFFEQVLSEPHSTKAREDAVGWAAETGPEVLAAQERQRPPARPSADILTELECPVLVVHGDADRVTSYAVGVEAARLSGGVLATFGGSGHMPNLRDPVRFNLLLHDFVRRVA